MHKLLLALARAAVAAAIVAALVYGMLHHLHAASQSAANPSQHANGR